MIKSFKMKIKYLATILIFFISYSYPQDKKHNILFIGIDDMRPQTNSYGHSQMITPNIDNLASDGIQFNQAYVNIAVCGASRASILTGIRGSFTRFDSYTSRADTDLPDAITLPRLFKNNGYKTASIGKIYHFADDSKGDWDDFYSFRNGSDYKNPNSLRRQQEIKKIRPDGKYAGPPFEYSDVLDHEYNDGKLTDVAIKQLKKYKDNNESFFLAVGYILPHLPFIQPRKYGELYNYDDLVFTEQRTQPLNSPNRSIAHDWTELRNWYIDIPESGPVSLKMEEDLIKSYYATITYLDTLVGKLIKSLDDLGLSDNTTIVFWSDHGFFLGEHGMWCKHHTFQEAIHVPLIISSPKMKKGYESNTMIEYIDLYPTICDIAGIKAPSYIHGKSFLQVLENPDLEHKSEIYSRYQTLEVVQDKKFSYHEVLQHNTGKVLYNMLFDMENDQKQYFNISGKPGYQHIVDLYSKKLKNMRDFTNKPIIIK